MSGKSFSFEQPAERNEVRNVLNSLMENLWSNFLKKLEKLFWKITAPLPMLIELLHSPFFSFNWWCFECSTGNGEKGEKCAKCSLRKLWKLDFCGHRREKNTSAGDKFSALLKHCASRHSWDEFAASTLAAYRLKSSRKVFQSIRLKDLFNYSWWMFAVERRMERISKEELSLWKELSRGSRKKLKDESNSL